MNTVRNGLLVALTLAAQGALAGQDVSGMSCTTGEWSITTGPAFQASCVGDLRVDASSVITADESITLTATGGLWMAGRLAAPRIVLMAEADAWVTGGLFSGSADFYPEVNAVSYAGSLFAVSRTFDDLVARPFVDPVYGALIATLQTGAILQQDVFETASVAIASFSTFELSEFHLIELQPEAISSPVPEPALPALLASGLALLAWRTRRPA